MVTVLSLHNTYEIGRALNPAMATQQVEGGAWMGVSHAIFESTEPYYPRGARAGRLQRIPDARPRRRSRCRPA